MLLRLQQYNFKVTYKSEKSIILADFLSRCPDQDDSLRVVKSGTSSTFSKETGSEIKDWTKGSVAAEEGL